MIPSDLAARLRMLTEASFFDSEPPVQGTAKVRELQARLPQLMPGQQFTATLERPLPDGTFQALVGGRSYTLSLNHSAKAGDMLELIVTRNAPNAVFAQLANPLAAGATEANRPSLSAAGRLISFVLTGQPAAQAALLAEGKPLLNAPPTGNAATQTLAPALRQALTQSGLFYEAHQLKWLSGKLDTASLLREPQGQLSTNLSSLAALTAQPNLAGQSGNAAGARGMSGTLAGLLLGLGLAPGEVDSDGNPLPPRTLAETGANPAGTRGTASSMAERTAFGMGISTDDAAPENQQKTALNRGLSIPDRLMPVLHQQLDALATQNYMLSGQAWPGQAFQWEIEDPWREHGDAGEGSDETNPEWNSILSITLPNLGGVEARLQLGTHGVSIRLLADEAQTVAALDAAREQLRSALETANLPLTGFVAERRDGG
nr:flagellar hook-length control protein FliK [Zoogloeaceae bacterium]